MVHVKGINNKVFSNLNIDPIHTLKLPKTESLLWVDAHISLTQEINQTRLPVEAIVLSIRGRWCFTDGSWKNQEIYLGQEWYSTLKSFCWFNGSEEYKSETDATSLGDKSSHLGIIMHEESKTAESYICNRFFSVGENGLGTKRMTSLCKT